MEQFLPLQGGWGGRGGHDISNKTVVDMVTADMVHLVDPYW